MCICLLLTLISIYIVGASKYVYRMYRVNIYDNLRVTIAMKNIILLAKNIELEKNERRKKIVDKIINSKHYKIVLLLVGVNTEKKYYESIQGIENVLSTYDIECMESMKGLNYNSIKSCKGTQLLVENYYCRRENDYQLDKYYYYAGLSFWLSFFERHNVDFVISTTMKHGFIWDICCEIAEKRGISSFYINPGGYNDMWYFSYKGIPYHSFSNKTSDVEYFMYSKYDKTTLPKKNSKKNLCRRILYALGGNLLEDFCVRLIHWDWTPMSVWKYKYKATWLDKFIGNCHLNNTERYLKKKSKHNNYVLNVSYIFYALHFEPEATIQVRTVLESQLVVIKLLSEAAPQGWKVLVKEHPAQFRHNNDEGYGFMIETPRFKNKKFYDKLLEMSNVEIVDWRIPSNEMIKHSKAVASITGTVCWEGVLAKKPVLMFSDIDPLAHASEVFNIHSYGECASALKKIYKGFVPKYKDVGEIVHEYYFKGEFMADNIYELLKERCLD